MGAITDLWNSERGLLTILLVIASTALCALGKLDVTDWTAYTKWALLIYTGGKTVTGVVSSITGKDTDGVPAQKSNPVVVVTLPTEAPKAA